MSADDERDPAEERYNADLAYLDADWTDTLRELVRFASDHELPRPLTVVPYADDHLAVAVSGPDHQAWFEHFTQGHETRATDVATYHRSHGLISASFGDIHVDLTCLADLLLPSAVAS